MGASEVRCLLQQHLGLTAPPLLHLHSTMGLSARRRGKPQRPEAHVPRPEHTTKCGRRRAGALDYVSIAWRGGASERRRACSFCLSASTVDCSSASCS